MAAHYLADEKKNIDFFIKTLLALRDATHLYTTYKLPEDAPLGRYWVHWRVIIMAKWRHQVLPTRIIFLSRS